MIDPRIDCGPRVSPEWRRQWLVVAGFKRIPNVRFEGSLCGTGDFFGVPMAGVALPNCGKAWNRRRFERFPVSRIRGLVLGCCLSTSLNLCQNRKAFSDCLRCSLGGAFLEFAGFEDKSPGKRTKALWKRSILS